MIKTITTLAVLACLTMFSCFPDSEDDVPTTPTATSTYDVDVPFRLEFEEVSACSCDEGPEVSFTQLISDSRCPSSIVCIWYGQISVQLDFNNEEIELGFPSYPSQRAIDTVGQWSIQLLDASPHPEFPNNPPAEAGYELELVIRELGE